MIGGTQQQHPQVEAQKTTVTVEEEALKRNTDCVYFLASPLTCKKGSECEYRHNDVARVNPRDCWFWLNGNCLNPKCGFRHPPLDGLLGTQVPPPAGSSLPPSQSAAVPSIHVFYTSGKQGVPCIFFQKGFCLKGDRCPFLHAPTSTNNKVTHTPAVTPVTEPSSLKKASGGLEKCTQEKKVPQINSPKPVELPQAKPAAKVGTVLQKNNVVTGRRAPRPSDLDDGRHRYIPTNVPAATNGNSISWSNRMHQAHVLDDHSTLNGKFVEDFSREPSPGFDVLVDDELRESDYYHKEDQFGRERGHVGRNLNSMNEYDIDHPTNYNSVVDVDRDVYRDPQGYDSYEHIQGRYDWEQCRASSERLPGGLAHVERKRYSRDESADQIDESDLRHRLSKQRRVNGLRSIISQEYALESHADDRSHWGPQRDTHHLPPPHESSLSSRLRGRIKMPGRSSSPVIGSDLRSGREIDRARDRDRLSPARAKIPTSQGRHQDRIKGKVQEDFNNEGRNQSMRTDMNDNTTHFAAPKSLAELKVGKDAECSEQHKDYQQHLPLGKRRHSKLEGNQQSEGDLSFEGPKPLSEILKRKREAGTAFPPYNNEDNIQKEKYENLIKTSATSKIHVVSSYAFKDEGNLSVHSNKEESKSALAGNNGPEYGLIHEDKSTKGEASLQGNVNQLESEDGMIDDETVEDQDAEPYDQRDGDFDFDQVDGEDYNIGEVENADAEEEYLDDDGDDFAKKMGVMYS